MVDFFIVSTRPGKRGCIEVYPKFIIKKSSDLMIRGRDFYAIWLEDEQRWSTDESDAIRIIDEALDEFAEKNKDNFDARLKVMHMWDAESRMIGAWHQYCQKDMRDSYHMLDEKLIFANTKVTKKDYSSKRLSYPLEDCPCPAYHELMEKLYAPEERHKIEWAIGSIVTGDSKKIQKFLVLYGGHGTGKSTVLNIIGKLFEGYCATFEAKTLGGANSAFALEAFRTNPLVAIDHDGKLDGIEDNTRLNSLVSHEPMIVNEKFKATYQADFKSFLFIGTNSPVRITDGKSGLIRRLIDVVPTGETFKRRKYEQLYSQIDFELGGIAKHCMDVYLEDPGAYDGYEPHRMLGATNDFYNFILEHYYDFQKTDGITQKQAWDWCKDYYENANVRVPYYRVFKEEMKNYFREYAERYTLPDGTRTRSYYYGFRADRFEQTPEEAAVTEPEEQQVEEDWLDLKEQHSIFNDIFEDCPAQYATDEGIPRRAWVNVRTRLKDIDSTKLHFVFFPKKFENYIVIDFDILGPDGTKSLEKNLKAASKWPKTYAEVSKSGKALHLVYYYTGDVSQLCDNFDEHIEIKKLSGNASLRRLLTKCNNQPIAEISSGLPVKGERKVINPRQIKSERKLREMVARNLNREYHANTAPSIDFIAELLEQAYNSGMVYDLSDMQNAVRSMALSSTNQKQKCLKVFRGMKFKSETEDSPVNMTDYFQKLQNVKEWINNWWIFDIESYPNLFIICAKQYGKGKPVKRLINPTPQEVEWLLEKEICGFNNRKYDNHMIRAAYLGETPEQLNKRSSKLIANSKNGYLRDAWGVSVTDIFDFCSKKQGLKKWEIEMDFPHQEMDIPWDEPVPESEWERVADYCENDVLATEATLDRNMADLMARVSLVQMVKLFRNIDMTINDTTNQLSAALIFGNDENAKVNFNYRDLSKPVSWMEYEEYRQKFGEDYEFHIFDENGLPAYEVYEPTNILPEGWSILPFFPGYKYENGESTYLGHVIGEGGRVSAKKGVYLNVWDGDVSSMHPHSMIFECLFGPTYTKVLKELVDARVAVKHAAKSWDFEPLKEFFDGVLYKLVTKENASDFAQALKIVINSIYGLTSASFDNKFKDERNIDNIVAKRGALFMTLLQQEVEKRGYTVAHIKTDSIKIPNATDEIRDFVCKFGKEYGYTFETEDEFDRFCLVNDAVYIAKFKEAKKDKATGNDIWWTATGTQFQVPYVFKTLFSHEDILFKDMCETKSVTTAMYLDFNEANEEEHHRRFVGRVGQFCPVKPGWNGGLLVREATDKKTGEKVYNSVTGAKGYRWQESTVLKALDKVEAIDISYYENFVEKAKAAIEEYCDFDWFVNGDSAVELPPWETDEEENLFAVR